ncbi:MAG: response regulator, partial [Proteobacteria bacterium]|nr:response regulator [Pseudomonadota bacterium]
VDPYLFPTFEDEANELLPQLGGALRQWSARPANAGARVEMLRALHTLKGSARLAGAMRLGEMAHRMESEVEQITPASDLPAAQLEPLLVRFDAMQADFDQLRQRHVASESAAASQGAAAAPQPAALSAEAAGARASAIAPAAVTVPAPQRPSNNPVVRVRSQLLDRLLNQAGEVMIVRSRLESDVGQLRGALAELTGNLERLRRQLRDLELQADSQMQSRLAQAKEAQQQFDPLEFDRFTRVQELTRMMAESVNDVATVQRSLQRAVEAAEDNLNAQAHQTREMQRDLLRTRMVEFESVSDRLYRVLRQAAKETSRQVKLDIVGGVIEMDRGVLDRMLPAFEHLLRNAVVHGIEDAVVRSGQGKSPTGTITIALHHAGNDVSVEFRDDGAGLDLDRIRAKARTLGLASAEQPLSDAQAIDLVFTPGFSTAAQVSELAGRGIGMDVVRAEVTAVGGRIETSTQPGQGTCFQLVLPLTTAVTQVVMLRADDRLFGVPSSVVETVRRVPTAELEQALDRGSIDHGGEPVPLFWAGALLQGSGGSSAASGKTGSVVVLQSAGQRVALQVDEVLGNQEVVVKNLGPQLSRLPGLAGMTVLASGAAVLIYNPVALAAVYGEQARRLGAQRRPPPANAEPAAAAPAEAPLVLVVDDSVTVRRVTQRLLQREGYRVALAVDGLQALQRLAEERPAVVLADIEMPRMDGFDLVRNIRADRQIADLPVIMITSRIAEKHKELARELGVNHYLGKPYSEEELLSLVRHYSSAEIEA